MFDSYDPNSMGYESAEVGHLLVDPANYDEINHKIKEKKNNSKPNYE